MVTRNGLASSGPRTTCRRSLRKSRLPGQFAYGPDHQRWRQVATYQNGTETTHYVGGLLEKESTTSTGLTYWRHYVPTPGGATSSCRAIRTAARVDDLRAADHLGSSDALLDETGATVGSARASQRSARAAAATGAQHRARLARRSRTPRGRAYTGHEMLDNVGLVHMNGRVYDPTLGRFLSADPLIGEPRRQPVGESVCVRRQSAAECDGSYGLLCRRLPSIFVARFLRRLRRRARCSTACSIGSASAAASCDRPARLVGAERRTHVRRRHVLTDLWRHDPLRGRPRHGRRRSGDFDLGGTRPSKTSTRRKPRGSSSSTSA